MVSFDAKRRYGGVASHTQQVGNFRNTVVDLPRLVGHALNDDAISKIEAEYSTCKFTEKDGLVAVSINYKGNEAVFSNVELTGMFLNKLKGITFAETRAAVSDVVISVPSYFTEKERRALIDAAEVAGLNCICTINDTTAAAINYSMTKSGIAEDASKHVIILDIGYSSTKASLVNFVKGKAVVKLHVHDANLGGRDFDEVLASHFAGLLLQSKKFDIRSNKKGMLRLRIACEKIKKVLSGIQSTKLVLETLYGDEDFTLEATREQFTEFSAHLIDRIEGKLLELLKLSGVSAKQVDSIEIIGGTTRIPGIKDRVQKIFGKAVSTTLNADEAVSRGAALLCAIESPLVRVRQHEIVDVVSYPIKCIWTTVEGVLVGEHEVFPVGTALEKVYSIHPACELPLVLEAHYSNMSMMPAGTESRIARFTVSALKNAPVAPDAKIVLDVKINRSGLFCLDDAFAETQTTEPAIAEGDEDVSKLPPRIVTRTTDLTFKTESFRLPRATIQAMKEAEIKMNLNDQLVADTDDCRNAVEELIYEARAKLEEEYAPVSSEAERESVSSLLNGCESWLYDEGADVAKEEYVKKFTSIQSAIKPFKDRIAEIENAKRAEAAAAAAALREAERAAATPSPSAEAASKIPSMDMD